MAQFKATNKKVYLLLFTILVAPTLCFGQQDLNRFVDDILLKLERQNTPLNGSLVIMNRDSVLYEVYRGFANFEHKVPIEPDTKFRLASLSKQFTALLVLKQVEEGRIELDKSIGDYLDAFRSPKFEDITIHHLLIHTSGLPSNPPYLWKYPISEFGWDFRENKSYESFDDSLFASQVADDVKEFEAGSKTTYNNSAYVLLGYLLKVVSGKHFEELLHDEIFGPLGMDDSGLEHLEQFMEKRAYNYEYIESGDVQPSYRFRDVFPIGPAGGLYSTTDDLKKWTRSIFYDKDLLTEESYLKMYTKNEFNKYAYGFVVNDFDVEEGRTVEVVWHTGQITGVQNVVAYVPELDVSFISLSNIGFTFPVNQFIRELVRETYKAFGQ